MAKTYNDLYNSITKKLGFRPEEYKPKYPHTEDDNYVSPLSVLSVEELQFLLDNKFFGNA